MMRQKVLDQYNRPDASKRGADHQVTRRDGWMKMRLVTTELGGFVACECRLSKASQINPTMPSSNVHTTPSTHHRIACCSDVWVRRRLLFPHPECASSHRVA